MKKTLCIRSVPEMLIEKSDKFVYSDVATMDLRMKIDTLAELQDQLRNHEFYD